MVERIVRKLADHHPDQRFTIVFSDHPLRPSLWRENRLYHKNGYSLEPELTDDKVPLIPAGGIPAAFVGEEKLGHLSACRTMNAAVSARAQLDLGR